MIYLAQHGRALTKEQDPARPLSEEGRAQTTRIAEVAAAYRVPVSRIEQSGKLRAQQTAEIMAEHLKPPGGVAARAGMTPKGDVTVLDLDSASELMLVGHLPFMERLIGWLTVGDPEQRPFKLQGGGIVCLDRDERGWHVKWALMPEVG